MSVDAWSVRDERVVYQDRWVRVALADVELPDGRRYEYTALRRIPGAGVVAFNEAGEILLQQEYRYPLDAVIYQIPGGLIDEGEEPIETAKRELLEETGHQASEWQKLGVVQDNPGLMNGSSTLFLASGVQRVADPQRDETEFLAFDWYPLEWLREKIMAGEIVDRVVLAAYAFLHAQDVLDC